MAKKCMTVFLIHRTRSTARCHVPIDARFEILRHCKPFAPVRKEYRLLQADRPRVLQGGFA